MSSRVRICGYAAPFDQIGVFEGLLEVIDRHAFDGMLAARSAKLPVLWNTHDVGASPVATTADLFVDDFGLGFSFNLDFKSHNFRASDNHWRLASIVSKADAYDQCSVGDLEIETQCTERHLLGTARRITKATIGHIAIVRSGTAAYKNCTGVWPTHCALNLAPYRIQQMAAQWEIGHNAWPVARAALRAKYQPRSTDRAIGRTASGDVVMCMSNGVIYARSKGRPSLNGNIGGA